MGRRCHQSQEPERDRADADSVSHAPHSALTVAAEGDVCQLTIGPGAVSGVPAGVRTALTGRATGTGFYRLIDP